MTITIPVRLSQAIAFLFGFLVALVLFRSPGCNADTTPQIPTDEQQMKKAMYAMLHDLWWLRVNVDGVTVKQSEHLFTKGTPQEMIPKPVRPNKAYGTWSKD